MFNFTTLLSNPLLFVVSFLALIISISVHEFSHVFAAYLQGDQTGKALGRLTLNPLRHLDPIGTMAILFIGLGWGRPAPFNPYALRYRRWGPALVALAGPISNIIVAALAGYLLLFFGSHLESGNLLRLFLGTLVVLNAALAVFNLIPIAPLDGSHLLGAVFGEENQLVRILKVYGPFILIGIIFLPSNPISSFILGGIRFVLRALGLSQLA